jgi:hypothetical protein
MVKGDGGRRRQTDKHPRMSSDSEGHVTSRVFSTLGAEASERWLGVLGLTSLPRWFVELSLVADTDTHFDLAIYAEEWGFAFHHAGKTSWIRVTDVPFVHGRDELALLDRTPDLLAVGVLISQLERDHQITFDRTTPTIRTNVADAEPVIRDWLREPRAFSRMRKTVELRRDDDTE